MAALNLDVWNSIWKILLRKEQILTYMNEEKKFFVYVDYTTELEQRPYYVGKGIIRRVRNLRSRNKLHSNIKEKYGFERRCVLGPVTELEAFNEEKRLITELKTYFYGGPGYWGCNFTLGGDGSIGHRQPPITEEHRELLRKLNSHPKSNETRLKMKEAAANRAANPEWRAKMSEVSKERWKSEDYKNLLKERISGKKRSEEQCQKFSEAQKLSWEDNDKRKRASESALNRYKDPAERKILSEKMRELWKDPDYRMKMMLARRKKKDNVI